MSFIAIPPAPAWPTLNSGRTFAIKVARYFWQPLVPFDAAATPPAEFPTESVEKEDEEDCVKFCQAIFDAAEERRGQLEQKAQWTFTAIGLIAPSLASIFVFALNDPTFTRVERAFPIIFLSLSAILMLLSYVSAARALWVRGREVLYLGAVIDLESGAFKPYSAAERARGFLYCASMNTAYNDHVAQFVRGAQVLAAVSIILFSAGAVSTTARSGRGKTAVVGIDVTHVPQQAAVDLAPLRDALNTITLAIGAEQQASTDAAAIKGLISRMEVLEAARLEPKQSSVPAVNIRERRTQKHRVKPARRAVPGSPTSSRRSN
jgi:hypothetical protein